SFLSVPVLGRSLFRFWGGQLPGRRDVLGLLLVANPALRSGIHETLCQQVWQTHAAGRLCHVPAVLMAHWAPADSRSVRGQTPRQEKDDVTETARRGQTYQGRQSGPGDLPPGLGRLLAPDRVWLLPGPCNGLLLHLLACRYQSPHRAAFH